MSGELLDVASLVALADEWFPEDEATAHIVECKSYSCPDCAVIACASDLRAALEDGVR